MKKIVIALAFMGTTFASAQAQDVDQKDVPQAVSSALTQKYANATDLDWEMDGANYEAEFDMDRVDHTVLLDPSGKILMSKRDIMEKDLPQTVRTAIGQNYKSMRLDDIELVEKEDRKSVV